MAQGKVEICGVNTAKLPVLNDKEKEALFARIKEGDESAKEEYIKGNLRLVLSVIKRFSNSNENPDDLFQIGCIGLIKAINNFNTELDVKIFYLCGTMIIGETEGTCGTTIQSASAVHFGIRHIKRFMQKKIM